MSTAKRFRSSLTLPNGVRRYYSGSTQQEADMKRDRDKLLIYGGANLTDNTTFEELSKSWFILAGKEDLHARSQDTINGILRRYILPQLGWKQVRSIKPADIMSLMRSVNELSNSTQRKVLQYTKSILQVGVDQDLLQKNPVISTIKAGGAKTEEKVPLTDEQFKVLAEAVKGTRAYTFIMLLRYTGLRKGEALGLMWSDINWYDRLLTVNRSVVYPDGHKEGVLNPEMKSSAAHRTIPIVSPLFELLQAEQKKSKSLYVFSTKEGGYLTEASFRRMWDLVTRRQAKNSSSYRDLVAKPITFDVHPHLLRHTCVTAWVEAGLDPKEVQYLAGHSSIDVTMEIYAHYREQQRRGETAVKMQNAAQNAVIPLARAAT